MCTVIVQQFMLFYQEKIRFQLSKWLKKFGYIIAVFKMYPKPIFLAEIDAQENIHKRFKNQIPFPPEPLSSLKF